MKFKIAHNLAVAKALLVGLVAFIAACSSPTSRPNSNALPQPAPPIESPEIRADDKLVVILYNDGAAANNLSVRAAQGLEPGSMLRPGTVGLYDHVTEPYGLTGQQVSAQAYNPQEAAQIYAIFLANLIGRYADLNASIRPLSQYKAGDALGTLRTFYLGTSYFEQVPDALIADVMKGAPITWVNYHIWNLDRAGVGSLAQLGLRYTALHAAYAQPEYATTYNRVGYRGYTYDKYVAPMEAIEVAVTRSSVTVHAEMINTAGRRIPYALQSGRFWYIADNPFVYMHETDRYLVFADLIGPMLDRDQSCEPRALARMEDVSPHDPAENLERMIGVYQKVGIPFIAATIPVHINRTVTPSITRNWNDPESAAALAQLRRIPAAGGTIFQHGYTHQFENLENPYGISGADFEFWRVTLDAQERWVFVGPIPGMTAESALERVATGRGLLTRLGLNPTGWVTPHYQADPSYYSRFNSVYNRAMERRIYRVGGTTAGQFFPYPVRDVNGTLMLPETMGSVQPGFLLDRMLKAAQANRALRCPWAGHFNHPSTLDPANAGDEVAISAAQFEQFLRSIQALGYRYVSAGSVTLQ
ncbi:MAG: polysaccharide deacetylase family protein [Meiothermus sp.]|nr:polysaccharide deacetylase family protein [Meiothermus sp.]